MEYSKWKLRADSLTDLIDFLEEVHEEIDNYSIVKNKDFDFLDFNFESNYWTDAEALVFDIKNCTDSATMLDTLEKTNVYKADAEKK